MSDTITNAANTPSIKKLLQLAKLAVDDKNFSLEKSYLDQACEIDSKNPKVLRALAKNARHYHDFEAERKALEALNDLKPDGKILYRLIEIASALKDTTWEKQLLLQKLELEPDNKKIPKRLQKLDELDKKTDSACELITDVSETESVSKVADSSINLRVDYPSINSARLIIYDNSIDINSKESEIRRILEHEPEENIVFVLSELYFHNNFKDLALQTIKKHKKSLNKDSQFFNIKLTNKVLELVSNKRTIRGYWDDFWYSYKKFVEVSNEMLDKFDVR